MLGAFTGIATVEAVLLILFYFFHYILSGVLVMISVLMGIVQLSFLTALLISITLSLYSAIIGLMKSLGADDKVKRLTYAKGLNSIAIFAFTDIFSLKWLIILSYAFPPYWITQVLKESDSFINLIIAFVVTALWLCALICKYLAKKRF